MKKIGKIQVILLVIFSILTLSVMITVIILSDRHTVYFNSNGGTEIASYEYVINNSTINEPTTPKRNGYIFEGWYYNDEPFDFDNFKITRDITLIASWSPINYSISYKFPEYSENPNTAKFYNVEQMVFLRPAIAKDLIFIGWYNNEKLEGIPITQINEGSYGDIVLYAKFKNVEIDLLGNKVIKDPEDLNLLRIFPNDNYILGNDIDLKGNNFIPIENFEGILNGNGFKIKNLKIDGEIDNVGLIENLVAGEINNLGVENFEINCINSKYVGVLASKLLKYSTINNCFASGNISIKSRYDVYVGGLIGYSSGSPGYTVSNSFSNSNFSISSDKSVVVGGLVGYFTYTKIPYSIIYYGSIFNSYANNYIRVRTTYESSIFTSYETSVGGLLGDSYAGTHHIYNSFSMGSIDVSANESLNCGYIAGSMNGFLNNCYANSDLLLKANNEEITDKAEDYKKLNVLPQNDIFQKIYKVWDRLVWGNDGKAPVLISFKNVNIVK